ncbi:MAG: hypothetical protein JOS17DRAFT_682251 [Linnemannia elongata]|nr:MAG: hypothetical protein JOS17DRAFT_682251 [Linnemannia elongata]
MVKLRVSVGGTYTDLAIVNCNDELQPIEFDAPNFKGRAVVRIKDFVGITNDGSDPITNSDYFKGRNRRFSFQIEGRFKKEWDGQQVYFGTDFDRSVELPDGFEMMLKVCRYIDPVVRTSLTKDGKPWILSPLVSSINTMTAWRPNDVRPPSPPLTPRPSGMPLGPWRQYVDEDTTFFLPGKPSLTTAQRRKYFQTEQNRKDFTFKTDVVHGFEFFSPHMDFNTFDIRLGLSMNVRKYLGGQPVRYICRTLDGETVFWAVQFELVD